MPGAWHGVQQPHPAQYRPKTDAERERMIKEADFAFRQAFAFCPYSPEAVFRYVQLLMNLGRVDDALMVARTCRKLDPYNGQVMGLIEQLEGFQRAPNTALQIRSQVTQLEKEVRANPDDFSKAFELASRLMQLQQTDRAIQVLDAVVQNPHAQVGPVLAVAQFYAQMNNLQKLEPTLEKLVKLAPTEPEAWYNLAATKAVLGKSAEALQSLRQAVDLSSRRLARDPKAHDLRAQAETDGRFTALRATPEYKSIFAPKP